MTADLSNLVRLQKFQIKPAAEMCARAFHDYPVFVYFFPDAAERKIKSPYIFQSIIRYGVSYGEVYATSPNLEGVAVWLPSEKADMTLWRMIRNGAFSLFFKFGKQVISRQLPVSKFLSSMHKRHAPSRHWFLQTIGVDSPFQGKGYASILLKAMFARIDKEHLSCYLDTEDEKNVSIYQHHGFKVVGKDIIPGTEITSWAMLRELPD